MYVNSKEKKTLECQPSTEPFSPEPNVEADNGKLLKKLMCFVGDNWI